MKKITMHWTGEDPDGNPFPVTGVFELDADALTDLVKVIEDQTEVEWL